MYSDVFVTGTVMKVYDPADDGVVFIKIQSNRTVVTKNGASKTFVNVALKMKAGYEQYTGKVEEGDTVFARGYLVVDEHGNPPFNTKKNVPVFVLVPWTVRVLGEAVSESTNDEFSVTLLGYLGKEPEMKFMDDGVTTLTNVSLATSRGFTDPTGERIKESTWWRITFWRKQAETINAFAHKGSRVLVVGSINYDESTHGPRSFTRKDGSVGASFEVTGNSFTLADSKGESKPSFRESGVMPNEEGGSSSSASEDDDDIPL